jgi:hypothetical protein
VARYEAIAAVGETIVKLLIQEKALVGDDFINKAHIDAFSKPVPTARPFLALHLYRMAHTTRVRQPDRVEGSKVARPVHTVDLHYLFMVWATNPKAAQVLLGWAMQTLAQRAYRLTAAQLNREMPDVFFADETVEFVPDTVSLQDLTNIWEIVKPDIQLSAAYVARSVTLHALEEPGPKVVQAREPNYHPDPEKARE